VSAIGSRETVGSNFHRLFESTIARNWWANYLLARILVGLIGASEKPILSAILVPVLVSRRMINARSVKSNPTPGHYADCDPLVDIFEKARTIIIRVCRICDILIEQRSNRVLRPLTGGIKLR